MPRPKPLPEYVKRARREFCDKYGVEKPFDAVRGHPDRAREWAALLYAHKKHEEGESWKDIE